MSSIFMFPQGPPTGHRSSSPKLRVLCREGVTTHGGNMFNRLMNEYIGLGVVRRRLSDFHYRRTLVPVMLTPGPE